MSEIFRFESLGLSEWKWEGEGLGSVDNSVRPPKEGLVNLEVWEQSQLIINIQHSAETGHFTQLVWKATQQVGCARTECNGGQEGGEGDAPGWYVVCEYAPRGNVIGQFVENVQAPVPKSQRDTRGANDVRVPEPEGVQEDGQEGGAAGVKGSLGALWVAVLVSCVGVVWV